MAALVGMLQAFVAPAPSHRASITMRVPVHRGLAPSFAAAPQLSPLTLGLQSVHAAAAVAGMAFPEQADAFAASTWHAFDACSLTHERMFEASLSVSCFVLFILGFESLHMVLDARRWRIDGALPKNPLHGFTWQWWKSAVPAVTYLGAIWIYHQLGMGQLLFGLPPAEVRRRRQGQRRWGKGRAAPPPPRQPPALKHALMRVAAASAFSVAATPRRSTVFSTPAPSPPMPRQLPLLLARSPTASPLPPRRCWPTARGSRPGCAW